MENFFDSNHKVIDDIKSLYANLRELKEKKYLIKSYMTKIESNLVEESDEEYSDENDISYKRLKIAYDRINEKMNHQQNSLEQLKEQMTSLVKFHIFKDLSQHTLTTKYKLLDCEFNFMTFKCQGNNKNSRWRHKNLG